MDKSTETKKRKILRVHLADDWIQQFTLTSSLTAFHILQHYKFDSGHNICLGDRRTILIGPIMSYMDEDDDIIDCYICK